MVETHPYEIYAEDSFDAFDDRTAPEAREDVVAGRPHEDAVYDYMAVSRHGGQISDGWRFVYACENYGENCPDAIGDMPVTRGPDGHPTECPDCGGRVYRLSRAWNVPMRKLEARR